MPRASDLPADPNKDSVQLLRFLGAIGAFAFLSVALVLLWVDPGGHALHLVVFLPLGLACLALVAFGRRLVERAGPPSQGMPK